jgi:DNA-binding YbaB/EbfC family protein
MNFNMNQMMKQAKKMQEQMQATQEKLATTEYQGQSGGKLVSLTINGQGKLLKITIDPSLLQVEEGEILEDLIIAAFNDAKKKSEEDAEGSMGDVSSLGLPPGMKLPF